MIYLVQQSAEHKSGSRGQQCLALFIRLTCAKRFKANLTSTAYTLQFIKIRLSAMFPRKEILFGYIDAFFWINTLRKAFS